MKHTVVFTAPLPDVATRLLSREFDVLSHDADGTRTEEELIDILAEADAVVTMLSDPVTRRVLESNPNLRMVSNYAVGTNNIDLEAANEHSIMVTNTPGVLTDATADLTWALILSVVRHVVPGHQMVRAGEFHGWHPLMLLGSSLRDKQLGIVGMGRIGHAVADRAKGFGMSIAYTSRSRHPGTEQRHGSIQMPLADLLQTSDIVSLHCPITPETRHMIDARAIATMKPGAYLINTARGPLVDEAALASALEQGQLRGAGLDVYEHEPSVEPRLLNLASVVLLPHLGSGTEETRNEMARMISNDIIAFFRGQRPVNIVQ
jgi:glyoxylate reductase